MRVPEKICCCCGSEKFERGATLFLIGNSIGKNPHTVGRAQRLYICETCETRSDSKPLSRQLLRAADSLLLSIRERARSRMAASASGGVLNDTSATV